MSSSITPPPGILGSMAVGDEDWRYIDMTPELAPENDPIASVAGFAVSRSDGTTSAVGDLTVDTSNVPIVSNGAMRVTFRLLAGSTVETFLIILTVQTTSGRTLNRAAYISVVAALG